MDYLKVHSIKLVEKIKGLKDQKIEGSGRTQKCYVCILEANTQIKGNILGQALKEAMELYFMYYLCVVIILFSTGLYISAFSTYSFGTFCVIVFHVSVSLAFNFQFCSMF